MKLIHIHLPKTAGTALRESIASAHPDLKICPARLSADLAKVKDTYDIYSGHFSLDDTKHLDGDYVTVLRDPVDRFISVYYFWKDLYKNKVEISRKTELAYKFKLEDFVKFLDEPLLTQEIYNRVTWQIAHSFETHKRYLHRVNTVCTDNQLLKTAINNLNKFSIIGFQDRYQLFINELNSRYSLNLRNSIINATQQRCTTCEISASVKRDIEQWVYLDMELFTYATNHTNLL